MLLQDTIDQALELTDELRSSLAEERPDAWDDVLARRADAMADFQDAHREADESVLTACGPSLEALASADHDLQLLAEEALAAAAAEFRDRLGAAPTGPSSYDDSPLQGAVNRRA
ncbi:MAG: hypothetical protein GY838_06900 [bacterium]|nr:hypothetical protein [bacterium]